MYEVLIESTNNTTVFFVGERDKAQTIARELKNLNSKYDLVEYTISCKRNESYEK
jgi:hypothetical protein